MGSQHYMLHCMDVNFNILFKMAELLLLQMNYEYDFPDTCYISCFSCSFYHIENFLILVATHGHIDLVNNKVSLHHVIPCMGATSASASGEMDPIGSINNK